MNPSMFNDTTTDTDFYLEASRHYPLLTAAQERQIDLRKWAGARRCARRLLETESGRSLMKAFCKACLEQPPEVEHFAPRSLFFTLRKDIVDLLPKGKHAKALKPLVRSIDRKPVNKVLDDIAALQFPTTLVTGLAIVQLRQQGAQLPDLMADALEQWQPSWAHRPAGAARPDPRLRSALDQYVTARDKLVMHNLRLVHKLAWDSPSRTLPRRDLVQDGIIGLIRAAEKFDFSRGYRFTTYAYPWINQHLQRATENKGNLITYPAHVVQEINQVHRVRMAHQEKTGQEPGIDLLAEETGFDRDKIRRLRQLGNITVSIDHPEADDNDLRHAASIPDPDSERAVEDAQQSSVARLLWKHIDKLEEREQAVITGRWGLDGRPQRTFAQRADQLRVSREWVRQLEKSALEKLSQEASLNDAFEEIRA